jgi:hypothetical protein
MFTISLLMSLTQLPTILPTCLVEVNSPNYMQPRLQSGQHKIIQRHCFLHLFISRLCPTAVDFARDRAGSCTRSGTRAGRILLLKS